MQVDLVAERPHYRDHILPIWNALPAEVRGTDFGDSIHPGRATGELLLVGGYSDVVRHPHRSVVYVEHGAGQSYVGLPLAAVPYYSPLTVTKQHRNVVAFICPNDEVASRWSRSYDVPTFVVGCPKLDPWHAGLRDQHDPLTVAVTFHWEPTASVWTAVPELQSAFGHYFSRLAEAATRWTRAGWHVIGHAHPRALNVIDFWRSECRDTVEFVHESSEILDRASVLVADNTSVQAEFMSLGRGVVFLNHPAYRRDVEHGGRFWQWPMRTGLQIDTPRDLVGLQLDSVPASTWHPYAYADGHATERAVKAILSLA